MSTKVHVSGLETHVYGLDDARGSNVHFVNVVFLLHGRTGTYLDMEPFAMAILARNKTLRAHDVAHGLIVVSFDQRNHGHRQVSEFGNLGWIQGNPLHAQDMFSIYYGTSQDVSLLITFLPAFLFPQGQCSFANIICAGISLGGHSTYLVLSNDERVQAGVVVIGCADYEMLMVQRAGEQDRETRLPEAFLELVSKLGPRHDVLSRKKLLILKGNEDQLVPWSASQGFVGRLPKDKAEVIGFPGVGHDFTDEMRDKCAEWIVDWQQRQ